jgi:hypothetical protein
MFGKGLPPGMHPARARRNYPAPHGYQDRPPGELQGRSPGRRRSRQMTPFYVAGVCLVVAQILGIYALVSRKADFTFALVMLLLVVVALASGADGVYRQLH